MKKSLFMTLLCLVGLAGTIAFCGTDQFGYKTQIAEFSVNEGATWKRFAKVDLVSRDASFKVGGGTVPYLSVIVLTAVPADGWTFIGWEDDASAPAVREITVLGDALYTALFQKNPAEGIDDVQRHNEQCTKVLRNGILYIEKNGKVYDARGTEVK